MQAAASSKLEDRQASKQAGRGTVVGPRDERARMDHSDDLISSPPWAGYINFAAALEERTVCL